MKKFLVFLAVLSMAQVFAASDKKSPGVSSVSQDSLEVLRRNAREAGGTVRGGNVSTGINAVAISSITQTPTASSGSGIAAAITGTENLPPLVLNCF